MKYEYSHAEQVIRAEMLKILKNFTKGESRVPFISLDKLEEKKYCKQMRKAAKRIYDYYSLPEDKIK